MYIYICCIRAVGSFLEFTHDETEVVSFNFLCTTGFFVNCAFSVLLALVSVLQLQHCNLKTRHLIFQKEIRISHFTYEIG